MARSGQSDGPHVTPEDIGGHPEGPRELPVVDGDPHRDDREHGDPCPLPHLEGHPRGDEVVGPQGVVGAVLLCAPHREDCYIVLLEDLPRLGP